MATERPLRFGQRMSDSEALMWRLEKDPALRSDFMNVTFLDRSPDFDRFRRRIEVATRSIRRLRQRVVSPPGNLAPPEWADDPSFDIDYHVRRVAVPAPGTERQLLDLAATEATDAFDRARPLWQFTIVDGLEQGRAAYLAKMHHTITDGVGGVRLSAMFIDLERDAPAPPPDAADDAIDPSTPEGRANLVEVTGRALSHVLRRQLGMSRRAVSELAHVVTHPLAVPRQAGDAVGAAQALLRQLLVSDPARSPLWRGRRSLGRQFEILSIELDALKRASKALGGTVNDGYVTGMAAAVGAYHRAKGVDVDELRFSMPVSHRTDKSAGGNAFTPIRFLIPVAEMPVRDRFAEVQRRINAERSQRSFDFDAFGSLLAVLPTSVLVRAARSQVETVDFAASNVRGAPFDLYTAGAHIEANHPMGPLGGTACNATVLSYRNSLDLGLNCDTAAIDDPGLLRECIREAFDELLSLGRDS